MPFFAKGDFTMGVFSEIAMEQQNSMFDSSAAFEDDEAFELEEMESLPVPPVGTDTVPVSAASVSAGETALADAEEEPADEVAPAGEEKSAEEGNSAQPPAAEDEEKKRAEYEAAEAQRKAEFDAKQQAKKAAEQEQIARLEAMSDEEVIAASTQRVSTDVEKLTRRNMKECVSEHIQMLCMEDTAFARLTMHPKKNMIRCFQYINRKAWDYVQDELKASGTRPGPGQQTYGCDVPDDMCYQWAEDYFRDPDAKEDHEDEEKFVPKPYAGKDGFVVREFQADRTYRKESLPNSKLYCQEIRRTIYDRELKPRSYYWGMYKQRNMRWISCSPCSYDWHGAENGRVYGKTLPHLEKHELRCTGLVQWIRKQKSIDPESYLAVWRRLPQMEQIWKSGLSKLTKECFKNCDVVRQMILYPEAPRLIRALGLDSQGFNRLRQMDGDTEDLGWLQVEKKRGKPITNELLRWFRIHKIRAKDILFIVDRMSPLQIRNYLQKQKKYFDGSCRQALITWQDYMAMAQRLHIDTSDEIIYRVRKLRQRHDELVIQCEAGSLELQAEKMAEKYPNVDGICRELQKKYTYAEEEYMVVAPENIFAIIKEGRMLHHCVGNDGSGERYYERMERRESFILFLRRTDEPEDPYYTLEIEPDGTVRQKRTLFDRQHEDIEQATDFLRRWQKVIAERLTGRDLKLAAESRILREKEFIQLKKDRVIIHTGHLAGRLLADVLMADLMENTDSIQSPALAAAA